MVIELAEYLSQCPALEGERVCVNYLDGDVGAVSLTLGAQAEEKAYADGGQLFVRRFVLAVREGYGKARGEMKRAAERFAAIEEWLAARERLGDYPDFGGKITVVSLGIACGFTPEFTGSVDARYEAEIELVFYKD
ncbi:MAG: hypothetical protein E7401_03415 [Ruminococcaceae bacterium]|nr:hypothetical protein [Oscillospiraceae bacterium]